MVWKWHLVSQSLHLSVVTNRTSVHSDQIWSRSNHLGNCFTFLSNTKAHNEKCLEGGSFHLFFQHKIVDNLILLFLATFSKPCSLIKMKTYFTYYKVFFSFRLFFLWIICLHLTKWFPVLVLAGSGVFNGLKRQNTPHPGRAGRFGKQDTPDLHPPCFTFFTSAPCKTEGVWEACHTDCPWTDCMFSH